MTFSALQTPLLSSKTSHLLLLRCAKRTILLLSLLLTAALIGNTGVQAADSSSPSAVSLLPPPLAEAQKQLNRRQFQKALVLVNEYLLTAPKDLQASFIRGVALSELSRTDEAIAAFTQLTEDAPETPEPYNNLAALYAKINEYDLARQSLEMAIRANPDYAVAYENLGDVYARLASQNYQKALSLDSHNKPLLLKLKTFGDVIAIPPQTTGSRVSTPTIKAPTTPF